MTRTGRIEAPGARPTAPGGDPAGAEAAMIAAIAVPCASPEASLRPSPPSPSRLVPGITWRARSGREASTPLSTTATTTPRPVLCCHSLSASKCRPSRGQDTAPAGSPTAVPGVPARQARTPAAHTKERRTRRTPGADISEPILRAERTRAGPDAVDPLSSGRDATPAGINFPSPVPGGSGDPKKFGTTLKDS